MIDEVRNFNGKIMLDDFEDIYRSRDFWGGLSKKSILITGAYGSIARYLCYYLLWLKRFKKVDFELYLNGRNRSKMSFYYEDYMHDFFPIYEDLSKSTMNLPNHIDFIFHAASPARPDLFARYPVETILPNTVGLNNLLSKYKNGHFLFFSSASVYGSNKSETLDENVVGLVNFLDVMSSYAESKRIGELLCKSYFTEYSVDAKAVRISHTFGPTLNFNEDTRAFSVFVKQALEDGQIVLKSDGSAKRAFLYVEDALIGMFDVLFKGQSGEAYNLGGERFTTITSFAGIIGKICDCPVAINLENGPYDSNSNHEAAPSNAKLKGLGWKQTIGIEEGLRKTIESVKTV